VPNGIGARAIEDGRWHAGIMKHIVRFTKQAGGK
jgi:hypothetical protein